jgi:hypothetical protein
MNVRVENLHAAEDVTLMPAGSRASRTLVTNFILGGSMGYMLPISICISNTPAQTPNTVIWVTTTTVF